MNQTLSKRSVRIAGHSTSVTLEPEFWQALREIAEGEKTSINTLIARIDAERSVTNLSSAIRISILAHYRNQP